MRFIDELKLNFTRSEGVFRLMLINISVFLVIGILKLFAFLSGSDFYFLSFAVDKLAMKASFSAFILQPWSIITYMFLHVNFMHI